MPTAPEMWSTLKETLLRPRADDAAIREQLTRLRHRLPVPVLWLLGKAQSGKTSIIRALTGHSAAEIGDGIEPCTRTARLYEFPDAETPLLKFLDTRGLGESSYDPTEDARLFDRQAHALVLVVKAMDHAQAEVLDTARAFVRRAGDRPIVVVQTTLHEGYVTPDAPHPEPYPFTDQADDIGAATVPAALARSLAVQRERIAALRPGIRFVPVDFTRPDDGYAPMFYGVEALWTALEAALPEGMLAAARAAGDLGRVLDATFARAAHPHIIGHATAAAAAGAVPVPLVDLPLTTLVQAKMFQSIASIYRRPVSKEMLAEFGSALGVGLLSRFGQRQLLKLVPVYGAAASALLSGATTYALGMTLCAYYDRVRAGAAPDPELLRELFAERFEQGKRMLRDTVALTRRGEPER